jgi:hypothetical protein
MRGENGPGSYFTDAILSVGESDVHLRIQPLSPTLPASRLSSHPQTLSILLSPHLLLTSASQVSHIYKRVKRNQNYRHIQIQPKEATNAKAA